MKWGINRSPGMSKNAGKVILLKTPKTATIPRTVDAAKEEEACDSLGVNNEVQR